MFAANGLYPHEASSCEVDAKKRTVSRSYRRRNRFHRQLASQQSLQVSLRRESFRGQGAPTARSGKLLTDGCSETCFRSGLGDSAGQYVWRLAAKATWR